MLTPEIKAIRKKGIGGSDAAAILGLNRYKTALDVYLEKTGQVEPKDISDKISVITGNNSEDNTAKIYEITRGVKVRRANKTFFHRDHNFMLANIDRKIIGQKAILECKSAGVYQKKEWGDEGTDYIPDEYLMQVVHYAAVCDVERVDIAVLFTDHSFKICTYERNEKMEQELIKIESDFWLNHVLKGVPPKPQNISDIVKLNPYSTDNAVLINEQLAESIKAYKDIQQQQKELKEKAELIKTRICEEMGDKYAITDAFGNKLATWKTQETRRLDSKALKKKLPDIYNNYTKVTTQRTFKVIGE